MIGRACLLLSILAVVLTGVSTAHLNACGDKFLRIGRSPRPNAYAAVHRASILLFVPAARPSDIKEYESFLKRAGHRPVPVRDRASMSSALAEGKYDIVIAALPDAVQIRDLAGSSPSKPELVPIVPKAQAASAEVGRQYEHVLKAGATKIDTLAELDRVMAIRLGNHP